MKRIHIEKIIDNKILEKLQDLSKKSLFGLTENETWFLRCYLGIYGSEYQKDSITKMSTINGYYNRYGNYSSYYLLEKIERRILEYQEIKTAFQNKCPYPVTVITPSIQCIKINEKYYIGNFNKILKSNPEEITKYIRKFEKQYPAKKIAISASNVLIIHAINNRPELPIDEIFENKKIVEALNNIGIYTLKELDYKKFNPLKYYEYLQLEEYNKIPILALFPSEIAKPFLENNFFTIEDIYQATIEELSVINPIALKEVLKVLKLLNPKVQKTYMKLEKKNVMT